MKITRFVFEGSCALIETIKMKTSFIFGFYILLALKLYIVVRGSIENNARTKDFPEGTSFP